MPSLPHTGFASNRPEVRDLPPGIGGGGTNQDIPPKGYGGGDSGDPDEAGTGTYQDRLRRCRLGIAMSLISITALFIALSLAYLVRQRTSVIDGAGVEHTSWMHLTLPPLLLVNTLILLLSSVTLEVARRKLRWHALFAPLASIPGIKSEEPRSLPWLGITLVLGFGFLAGQWIAWRQIQRQGFYLHGNPSSAFFYLLTGAHAVHLTVGLLALTYAALAHWIAHRVETRCLVVDVTSWYWHFMVVLWLGIYALLALAR